MAGGGLVRLRAATALRAEALVCATLCALLWAPAAPALAQPLTITCPMRVVPRAVQMGEMPAGFSPAQLPTSLSYLIGVGLLEGAGADPVERAPVVMGAQWQWTLDAARRSAVVCRYEGGISLVRGVPPQLRQCTATVTRSAGRGMEGYGLDRAVVTCQ